MKRVIKKRVIWIMLMATDVLAVLLTLRLKPLLMKLNPLIFFGIAIYLAIDITSKAWIVRETGLFRKGGEK